MITAAKLKADGRIRNSVYKTIGIREGSKEEEEVLKNIQEVWLSQEWNLSSGPQREKLKQALIVQADVMPDIARDHDIEWFGEQLYELTKAMRSFWEKEGVQGPPTKSARLKPKAQPKQSVYISPEPVVVVDSDDEPQSEQDSDSDSYANSSSVADSDSDDEPRPESMVYSGADPSAVIVIDSDDGPQPEDESKPEPEPAPELGSASESEAETSEGDYDSEHTPEPAPEPEPEAESEPDIESEPEPESESELDSELEQEKKSTPAPAETAERVEELPEYSWKYPGRRYVVNPEEDPLTQRFKVKDSLFKLAGPAIVPNAKITLVRAYEPYRSIPIRLSALLTEPNSPYCQIYDRTWINGNYLSYKKLCDILTANFGYDQLAGYEKVWWCPKPLRSLNLTSLHVPRSGDLILWGLGLQSCVERTIGSEYPELRCPWPDPEGVMPAIMAGTDTPSFTIILRDASISGGELPPGRPEIYPPGVRHPAREGAIATVTTSREGPVASTIPYLRREPVASTAPYSSAGSVASAAAHARPSSAASTVPSSIPGAAFPPLCPASNHGSTLSTGPKSRRESILGTGPWHDELYPHYDRHGPLEIPPMITEGSQSSAVAPHMKPWPAPSVIAGEDEHSSGLVSEDEDPEIEEGEAEASESNLNGGAYGQEAVLYGSRSDAGESDDEPPVAAGSDEDYGDEPPVAAKSSDSSVKSSVAWSDEASDDEPLVGQPEEDPEEGVEDERLVESDVASVGSSESFEGLPEQPFEQPEEDLEDEPVVKQVKQPRKSQRYKRALPDYSSEYDYEDESEEESEEDEKKTKATRKQSKGRTLKRSAEPDEKKPAKRRRNQFVPPLESSNWSRRVSTSSISPKGTKRSWDMESYSPAVKKSRPNPNQRSPVKRAKTKAPKAKAPKVKDHQGTAPPETLAMAKAPKVKASKAKPPISKAPKAKASKATSKGPKAKAPKKKQVEAEESEEAKDVEESESEESEPEAPEPEAPEHEAPESEAPESEESESEAPEFEAPGFEAPESEAPEFEESEPEAPEPEAPEHEAPESEAPESEESESEAPEFEAPGFEAPESEAPEFEESEPEAPEPEAPEPEAPKRSRGWLGGLLG